MVNDDALGKLDRITFHVLRLQVNNVFFPPILGFKRTIKLWKFMLPLGKKAIGLFAAEYFEIVSII